MKLHIGNIQKDITDAQLLAVVTPFGDATLEIVRDHSGASKGFGFAEFGDDTQGQAAIAGLDGTDVGGQAIRVAVAKPRKGEAVRA